MAFSLSHGDTRPTLVSLAAAALLGWGLYLYSEVDKAGIQRAARQEVLALSASEESLRTRLAQQGAAAQSIADLQNNIAAVAAELNETTQARDQVQAQLASAQKELEAWQQKLAQVSQLQSEIRELSQAWTQLHKELADVNGRLQPAEQELAEGRAKLVGER
jgi:peptidoglycan hydrolase CwlO-like protein